jgi:electron transfer flavoprotein alpha subunit
VLPYIWKTNLIVKVDANMESNVLILAEQQDGDLADITYELLAAGRELADHLGSTLEVLLLGDAVGHLSASLDTADLVLLGESHHLAQFTPTAYQSAIKHVLQTRLPRIFLLGSTAQGLDIASPLAASLRLPLVAYCRKLWVEDGLIVAQSQLYGGKLLAESVLPGQGIVALTPGSYPRVTSLRSVVPKIERIDVSTQGPLASELVRIVEPERSDVDISRQELLVAVGRGIGDRDNLSVAEELASALGAALCGSRPLVDNGWLPKSRQVGKSGLTVKPKLYLAAGISGAPEHIEGMKDAELIIAINTDPKAPIFDVAHYGIVGDLLNLLPAITDAVKAAKG